MSKGLAYIITLIVCILLQLAIAPVIAIMGASPNFLLIPVLLIASRSGAGAGGVAGFLLGLLSDFAGDGVIGAAAFSFTLVALIVGLMGSAMEMSPAVGAVIGLVFGVASELVYGLVCVLGSMASTGAFSTALTYALPCGIYTGIFAALALLTMGLVVASEQPQMGSRFSNSGGVFK